MKKFVWLFCILFSALFFAPSAYAETQYDWTTGTITSESTSTSTALRNLVNNSTGGQYLLYTAVSTDSPQTLFYASSTDGLTWSTFSPLWTPPNGHEIITSSELATADFPEGERHFTYVQTDNAAYAIPFDVISGDFLSAIEYTTAPVFTNPDIGGYNYEDSTGLLLWGLTRDGLDNYLFTTASTTGEYTEDAFETASEFQDDSSFVVVSDTDYVQIDEQTRAITVTVSSEERDVFYGAERQYLSEEYTLKSGSGSFIGEIPIEDSSAITRDIQVDPSQNSSGVVFLICNGNDSYQNQNKCGIYFAARTGFGTFVNAIRVVDHVIPDDNAFAARVAITSFQSGYPIIVYNNGDKVQYAMKDPSGSGNGSCYASGWSCGTIADLDTDVRSISIAGPNRTNANSGIVSVIYSDAVNTYFARGSIYTAPTPSLGTAFPKTIAPKNPRAVVNNGSPVSVERIIPVVVSAEDASHVAISTSPDFINTAWQEIASVNYLTLPEQSGDYTVYIKFTNTSGGETPVITSGIAYAPQLKKALDTFKEVFTNFIKSLSEAISKQDSSSTVNEVLAEEQYKTIANQSFVPEYIRQLESQKNNQSTIPLEQVKASYTYACDMRPNAFTLGGSIIRDTATKKLFVIDSNRKIACEVPSTAVARSWGVTKYGTGSVSSYMLATPLSYRPGTVVVDSKTSKRYFTNSRGELHMFPSLAQYRTLGYANQAFYYDTTAAISMLPRSADLTRTDIHPDGTLFVLDKKKGEYAILHNRVLHPLTYKSLLKYGEKPTRAISLKKGEVYPIGDRWDF